MLGQIFRYKEKDKEPVREKVTGSQGCSGDPGSKNKWTDSSATTAGTNQFLLPSCSWISIGDSGYGGRKDNLSSLSYTPTSCQEESSAPRMTNPSRWHAMGGEIILRRKLGAGPRGRVLWSLRTRLEALIND